ncbi:MAG: tRNA uridine-5-carboxymethylaminomethyl(34) synthesis GTPase MnmE, partial [Gammaproteobacteria bacterium]|nr:tRNA uridine-5-carboxymethylaminomethyl(34) synthesis GTPase MnmE [Gammaproteobacteria bacterium]
MPPIESDTICAIATPPGRGGIGIIRISGKDVLALSSTVLGFTPTPRHAYYCNFLSTDQQTIDQGVAIYFKAPHSFTGEDILELQGHGGVHVLNALLERIVALGIRVAGPGEFSERAFLNNKIDLLQAEAIADLVDASSKQAAQSAIRTLQGEFSSRIHELVTKLT